MGRPNAKQSVRLLLAAGVGAALAGCGGSSKPAASSTGAATTTSTITPTSAGALTSRRLTFDKGSGPLGFVDHGIVTRQGTVAVHDISYLSGGKSVAGYLLVPAKAKARPGIVLVHGSGGDRGELLGTAIQLAKRGAVALTITEPSSAHPPPAPTTAAQLLTESKATTEEDVVAVRRAGDVLQALPAVAPGKLGYLGWSAGAKTGAFVAASDPRFKALALLSGGADTLTAFVAAAPAAIRPKVRTVLGSVDPLRYLAYGKPGTILLEDGTKDTVVPHEALENFINAAPSGTVVHWFKGGHQLTGTAYTTAFAWLLGKLS